MSSTVEMLWNSVRVHAPAPQATGWMSLAADPKSSPATALPLLTVRLNVGSGSASWHSVAVQAEAQVFETWTVTGPPSVTGPVTLTLTGAAADALAAGTRATARARSSALIVGGMWDLRGT